MIRTLRAGSRGVNYDPIRLTGLRGIGPLSEDSLSGYRKNERRRRTSHVGRTETDGHSVSYRLGTARRERLPSGALIVRKFGSSVLGTRAHPAVPASPPCLSLWRP